MPEQIIGLWPGFEYKPHQETGIAWMLQRERKRSGGVLCDEMGLGKTIETVGLIKSSIEKGKNKQQNLLVAPVAVLEQWKAVIRRSGMTVKVPSPSGVSWVVEGKGNLFAPEIHCIGYEAATRKPTLLTVFKWHRVIYDEAHRIASGNSGTELAKRLKTSHMWMLTGTPIVNKVKDLSTLLELVGVKSPGTNMDTLGPHIKSHVLARTMEQLRATIPDAPAAPIYKTLHLEFKTPEEAKFYKDKTDIIANRLSKLGKGSALERLKLLMRLRQVSLHPQIYNEAKKKTVPGWDMPDWTGSQTKFDAIRDLICSKNSHKWIIFCHFRHEMTMLEEMLKVESSVELIQQYHGGCSAAQKADILERTHMPLMEGKQEVLLVQLQSGGTGLNLQHFDQIIFTGPWWTKALMEQAVGRAVRIGQKKQVVVYLLKLIAEDEDGLNIDHFMFEKADAKGDLCRKVLEGATTAVRLKDLVLE